MVRPLRVTLAVVLAVAASPAGAQELRFTDDLGGVGTTSAVLFRPGGGGMATIQGTGTRPAEPPQTFTSGGGGTGGGLVDTASGQTVGQCWIQLNGWITDNGIAPQVLLDVNALATYDPSQWSWSGSSLIGTVGYPFNTLEIVIPEPRPFSIVATGDITPTRFTLFPRSGGAGISGNIINPGHYQIRFADFFINASPSQPTRTLSGTWTLRVHCCCPADWDESGVVNSGDVSAFLSAWLASLSGGNLVADFNGSGAVNSQDISAFLSAWLAAVDATC